MKKLSRLCKRAHIKPALLFPILAIMCLGFFAIIWHLGPETKAAGGGQSVIDASGRPVPQPQLWSFLFRQPFVPIARADADREDALVLASIFEDARKAFYEDGLLIEDKPALRRGIARSVADELEDFVANKPLSTWTPSVRNQLGLYHASRGATTRAMYHWRIVWDMTGGIDEDTARKEADFALAHYARQLVLLGQTDLLEELYSTHRARPISGGLHEHWSRTMEKHVRMIKYPHDGYKCGIYALDQVGQALSIGYSRAALLNTRGTKAGFTLADLERLSVGFGFRMVPVARSENSSVIPFPAVIHWQQNHYAAIIEQVGDVYKVVDPSAAGVMFLTAEEINEEASGYFLVEPRLAGGQLIPLSSTEASQIIGKASGCPPEYWEDGCGGQHGGSGGGGSGGSSGSSGNTAGAKCPGGCGLNPMGPGGGGGPGGGAPGSGCETNCPSEGMISWRVSEPYLNVFWKDTPLFYTPTKGPKVALTLNFKQTGVTQLPTFGFGYQVSHPWQSAVYPDPAGLSDQVTFPGPTELYFAFSSSTATNGRTFKSSAVLQRTFSSGFVSGYYLHFADGSQWHYETQSSGNFYLSKVVAPDGYYLTIARDTLVSPEKIDTITDADGGIVEFHYEDPTYDFMVTRVTAPGSREASFQYEKTRYVWNLTNITDAAGLSCALGYGGNYNQLLTSITTPYGTTLFDQPTISYGGFDRAVLITLPTGAREAYLLVDQYSGGDIPSFFTWQLPTNTPFATGGYPQGTIETGSRELRNTFYWNAKNYSSLSNTNIETMTWTEFKRARIRHWLWKLDPSAYNHVDTLNHEQLPSPDGGTNQGAITWYDYDGKSYTSPEMRGSRMEPAVIARVQPDGSTWWTHYKRNDWGRAYEEIESWLQDGSERRRTNTYVWSSDGIDLLAHWFSTSADTHLKVGYGYTTGNRSPVRMTNSLEEITYYTYVSNLLHTVSYPSGLITSNVYSGSQVVQRVDFLNSAPYRSQYFTWENGLVKIHTDFRGLAITNHYDKLNRLTKVDFPNGTNIVYAYTNGAGTMMLHRTYMRNEVGAESKWEYNSLAAVSKEFDPLGRVTAYGYCDCGSLHSVTNAFGSGLEVVTSYVYDDQGKVTETYRTGGINSTNVYDIWGRTVIQSDALGSVTNWFDNLGRLVIVSNAFGQLSRTVYDDDDMVSTNVDANGVSNLYTYDDLHRILTQEIVGGGTNTWQYPDFPSGPTNHVNELGKVTQYAYNAMGWKMEEVIVGMSTNSFTYSAAGDLLGLSDGKNQLTQWGYDTFGRVTSKVAAASTNSILTYAYYLNGALSNRWSAAKGNTKYSYDAVGNLTSVNYAASTDLNFAYDAMNRVTNMVDAAGTTTNYYDVANRFMIEDGPWANDTVTNRWNTAGLPESIDVLQPSSYYNIAFKYDSARRMTNVNGTAGSFTNYFISGLNSITAPSRLIQQVNLANSSHITNNFDSLGRLTKTALRNGSTLAELNRHEYVYNDGHQRMQQTRKDGDYVDYLYDDAGQLYSAKTYALGGAETTSQRRGYTYDPAWNLTKTTNNATVSTRTVNNLNQITASSGGSHGYDNNGNRISDSGTYSTYVYDDENQLVQRYNNPSFYSGATKTDFTYDGKGRLRRRIEHSWNSTFATWTQVSDTRYIYSGMLAIQERNGSNVPEVSYTRGWDLSGSLEGAGGIGGLLARSRSYSSGSWGNHDFYHADGNGNITMMLDSSQATVATYKYDPYGNSFTASGALASANLYRFSSKLWCANAGLYYYGYRFYDPSLQRWLNRDPVHENGGINLYGFVGNNPENLIDPHGLDFGSMLNGLRPYPPLPPPRPPVKYCQEPGLDGHAWLEYPGGSVGFYPGTGPSPLWPGGPGTIQSPDPHAQDKDKRCKDVPLNPQCYDQQKFEDCIADAKNDPPAWYCVIGDNCRDWADQKIRECKSKARK